LTKYSLRIGFIGAGSIGSLFGGYLANIQSDIYSIDVTFFNNRPFIDVINRKGLRIYKNQDILLIKNIVAYESEKPLEDIIKKDPSFKFDFMFLEKSLQVGPLKSCRAAHPGSVTQNNCCKHNADYKCAGETFTEKENGCQRAD